MRLAGIATIAAANAFLPSYVERHNRRFARPAFDSRDLRRPLAPHDDLGAVMVWRELRTITAALTLHYKKAMLILEPNEISAALARKQVTVCEFPDGKVEIQHEGHVLPYRLFDKMRQVNQAAVVDNKQLGAALAVAQQLQAMMPHHRQRNIDAPPRRSQPASLSGARGACKGRSTPVKRREAQARPQAQRRRVDRARHSAVRQADRAHRWRGGSRLTSSSSRISRVCVALMDGSTQTLLLSTCDISSLIGASHDFSKWREHGMRCRIGSLSSAC